MPMLINRAARLTTIRFAKGRDPHSKKLLVEKIRLYPAGDAKEVPAEAMKMPFVKAKLKSGELEEVGGAKVTATAETSNGQVETGGQGDTGKQAGKGEKK